MGDVRDAAVSTRTAAAETRRAAARTIRAALALALPACVAIAGCGPSGGPADRADAATAASPDAPPPVPPDAAGPQCADSMQAHQRAAVAIETLLRHFWRGSAQYLGADSTPSSGPAAYWIYAQALDAVEDGVERTNGAHYAGMIETLWLGQKARGFSSAYYDDENWLALALIRAYDLTGTSKYLGEARMLFSDISAAWDMSCCGATPGGIWWDRAHTQKATASNAGPVITAARLAARTGDATDLSFAEKVYDYWWKTMVDPSTHQVFDHIKPDGTVVKWKFTYNEGVMIGASLALYKATGDSHYLDNAKAVAKFMLASETEDTPDGPVLTDGTGQGCTGDCQQFKGIGYRYLDELDHVAPDPAVRAVLAASAASVWARARDPATDHFGTDWAGPPPTGPVTLAQQSAAAMALNRYAISCGPGPAYGGPYEAEDGVLHHVGLEARYGAYSGWGYIAGWHLDGQGVDIPVKVGSGGQYKVTFAFSAAAGDAIRQILVDGTVAVKKFTFPGTGAWDSYAKKSVTLTLNAGVDTISVMFSQAGGSAKYLNLDLLAVSAGP